MIFPKQEAPFSFSTWCLSLSLCEIIFLPTARGADILLHSTHSRCSVQLHRLEALPIRGLCPFIRDYIFSNPGFAFLRHPTHTIPQLSGKDFSLWDLQSRSFDSCIRLKKTSYRSGLTSLLPPWPTTPVTSTTNIAAQKSPRAPGSPFET